MILDKLSRSANPQPTVVEITRTANKTRGGRPASYTNKQQTCHPPQTMLHIYAVRFWQHRFAIGFDCDQRRYGGWMLALLCANHVESQESQPNSRNQAFAYWAIAASEQSRLLDQRLMAF